MVHPAGDRGIDHRSIGQRIARMRAAILESKVAVARVDTATDKSPIRISTALARRDGLGWRDLNPLHSANLFCRLRCSLDSNTRLRRALTALAGASGIVPRNHGRHTCSAPSFKGGWSSPIPQSVEYTLACSRTKAPSERLTIKFHGLA